MDKLKKNRMFKCVFFVILFLVHNQLVGQKVDSFNIYRTIILSDEFMKQANCALRKSNNVIGFIKNRNKVPHVYNYLDTLKLTKFLLSDTLNELNKNRPKSKVLVVLFRPLEIVNDSTVTVTIVFVPILGNGFVHSYSSFMLFEFTIEKKNNIYSIIHSRYMFTDRKEYL